MQANWFIYPLIAGLMVSGCSSEKTPVKKVKTVAEKTVNPSPGKSAQKTITEKQKLLFFINPNGRPCQMQDSILDRLKSQIEDEVDVIYIKTNDPTARDTFYKYGIRSLPSIIIADSKGNPLKRFPPGIQNEETILNGLEAF